MKKIWVVVIFLVILVIISFPYIFKQNESNDKQEIIIEENNESQEKNNIQIEPNLVLSMEEEHIFNGVDTFIDFSDFVSEASILEEGTILFSFKFESLLDSQTIMPLVYLGMNNENDPDNMFVIEIGHSGGSKGEGSGSEPDPSNTKLYTTWIKNNQEPFLCFDTNKNLDENIWYNYAVVVDNSGNKGYLNGQEIFNRDYNFGSSSDSYFLNSINSPEKLWVGKGKSSSMISPVFTYFKGSIKNLKIYNKAFTSEEIAEVQ